MKFRIRFDDNLVWKREKYLPEQGSWQPWLPEVFGEYQSGPSLRLCLLLKNQICAGRFFGEAVGRNNKITPIQILPARAFESGCYPFRNQANFSSAIAELKAILGKRNASKFDEKAEELTRDMAPLFSHRMIPLNTEPLELTKDRKTLVYAGSGNDIRTPFLLADPDLIIMLDSTLADKLRSGILAGLKNRLKIDKYSENREKNCVVFKFVYNGRLREVRIYGSIDIRSAQRIPKSIEPYDIYLDKGSCQFFCGTAGHRELVQRLSQGGIYISDASLLRFDADQAKFFAQTDSRFEQLQYVGTLFNDKEGTVHLPFGYLNFFRRV